MKSFFQHIYCLNLPHRLDRRLNSSKEFQKVGIMPALDVEYFEAIDGKLLGRWHELTPGQVGCRASFLSMLGDMVEKGYESAVFFEDDVEFAPDALKRWELAISDLPDDWDMLYLAAMHWIPPVDFGNPHFVRCSQTFATIAFGVTREMAPKLIEAINASPEPVDVAIASLHAAHNCYAFQPPIAWQTEGFSDVVGADRGCPHFLKTGAPVHK